MEDEKRKKLYIVTVERTITHYQDIRVEADSAEDAKLVARMLADSTVYARRVPTEYMVVEIKEVRDEK
jgi:hypothetical protein